MRLRPHLSVAAVLVLLAFGSVARAQDWSVETKALDASTAQSKAKKSKQQTAAKPDDSAKSNQKGKVENRQFGELEGWSPGKSPPKGKQEEKGSRFGDKAPVSMSPSGGMSVGMPF